METIMGKKPRTKSDAPGADGGAGKGHNSEAKKELTADEKQELFLHHRGVWNGAQAKVKAAKKILDDAIADLKSDGFTRKQMEIADSLGDVAGEKKIKAEVRERLQVAQWLGHAMGNQLDLFDEPDRTPIVDRAYQDGKRASMQNKPRKPPHAPETEASTAWFAGYDNHQRELVGGLKAPDDVNQSKSAHGETAH
jgi:hypothetical protein